MIVIYAHLIRKFRPDLLLGAMESIVSEEECMFLEFDSKGAYKLS